MSNRIDLIPEQVKLQDSAAAQSGKTIVLPDHQLRFMELEQQFVRRARMAHRERDISDKCDSLEVLSEQPDEYWIAHAGIDRDVIVNEASRYLGRDAEVRSGKNYEGPLGYLIKACRAPTTAMIQSQTEISTGYTADLIRDNIKHRAATRHAPEGFISSDWDLDTMQSPQKLDPLPYLQCDRTHICGAQCTSASELPLPNARSVSRDRRYSDASDANDSALPLPDARNVPRERPFLSENLDIMRSEALKPRDYPFPTSNPLRNAPSESGKTYQTMLPASFNLRTRLTSVCCEGPYSGHTIDAYLDTGATHNVISQKLYTILEAMDAGILEDDSNASQISSPTGEPIDVLGATKVNIRWFDHEGENKRRKIRFKIIPGLYPDMILKPTTFQELDMLLAADTWPLDDPRKGFLMFNTPWMNSKTREENKIQHELKKAANAARAALESQGRKDQMQARDATATGSAANSQQQNATTGP